MPSRSGVIPNAGDINVARTITTGGAPAGGSCAGGYGRARIIIKSRPDTIII